MRRISHICREQVRRAGRATREHAQRVKHAARKHARQLRHEFRHRRPHRLRHRLVILGGTLAAVVGLWFFVQGRAAHILQREFGRAMGAGWTLRVGRMGMNPLRSSYSAHDIYIRYGFAAGGTTHGSAVDAGDTVYGTAAMRDAVAARHPKTVRPARKPLDLSLDGVVIEGLSSEGKSLTINYLSLIKPRIKRGLELRVHVGWAAVNRDSIVSLDFAAGLLKIARASHLNNDQSVRMSLDKLLINTAAHTLSVARTAIEPTYPKAEFAKKSWSHGDWTQVLLHNIAVKGVDFGRLLSPQVEANEAAQGTSKGATRAPLLIDSVHIGGGSIASFKDRNVARTEVEKPMYHTLLQQVTPYVKVRTVSFDNINAAYEELAVRGTTPGRVEFGTISGTAVLSKSEYSWQITALMQGAATLTASGTLPLKGDIFTMKGTLGHCDAAIFNPIALPLGGIKIVGGALGGLHFVLTGDSQTALARVDMAYQGLEVAVFSRRNRERRLLSAIANDIMLERTIGWREAAAEQPRNPLRSPWNYIWHSIFAAAKEPIGMKAGTSSDSSSEKNYLSH